MSMMFTDYIRDVPGFPKPGILFKDITPLLGSPQAFRATVDTLKDMIWDQKPQAIAALDARGFIFGGALSYAMGIPFIPIRKKGKLPSKTQQVEYGLEYGTGILEIHTDACGPGTNVLVIDDLLATGGTAAAACILIESIGARVSGLAFLVELSTLNGRGVLSGHDVRALITY